MGCILNAGSKQVNSQVDLLFCSGSQNCWGGNVLILESSLLDKNLDAPKCKIRHKYF